MYAGQHQWALNKGRNGVACDHEKEKRTPAKQAEKAHKDMARLRQRVRQLPPKGYTSRG